MLNVKWNTMKMHSIYRGWFLQGPAEVSKPPQTVNCCKRTFNNVWVLDLWFSSFMLVSQCGFLTAVRNPTQRGHHWSPCRCPRSFTFTLTERSSETSSTPNRTSTCKLFTSSRTTAAGRYGGTVEAETESLESCRSVNAWIFPENVFHQFKSVWSTL